MRIALLITTYNRPDALHAIFKSVERQTRKPDEIIVGDDGSGPETKAVIDAAGARGLPVVHAWQPDEGFRVARVRNIALAAVTSDYVVMIDGDFILHHKFIADHAAVAEPGCFVQAKRALLGEAQTRRVLDDNDYWPSFFASGIERRRHLVHSLFLSRLYRKPRKLRGHRTCNFAVWMEDAVRINGFDEDFVGWGREDDDFARRLLRLGRTGISLKFAGLGCHLHHPPSSRTQLENNSRLLEEKTENGAIRCENGLDQHHLRFRSTAISG